MIGIVKVKSIRDSWCCLLHASHTPHNINKQNNTTTMCNKITGEEYFQNEHLKHLFTTPFQTTVKPVGSCIFHNTTAMYSRNRTTSTSVVSGVEFVNHDPVFEITLNRIPRLGDGVIACTDRSREARPVHFWMWEIFH